MSRYLAQLKAANSVTALPDPLPKLPKGAFGSNDSSSSSTFSEIDAANTATASLPADRWLVHFADRGRLEVILSEPATHTAILARYPTAVAAEPVVRRAKPATERDVTELRRLLNIILADEPDEIAQSLAIACADTDDALMSFRALVADRGDGA